MILTGKPSRDLIRDLSTILHDALIESPHVHDPVEHSLALRVSRLGYEHANRKGRLPLRWRVPYVPGTLEVRGVRSVSAEHPSETGAPDQILSLSMEDGTSLVVHRDYGPVRLVLAPTAFLRYEDTAGPSCDHNATCIGELVLEPALLSEIEARWKTDR